MAIRKVKAARYLPMMISQSRTGEVSSNSMVPSFCSSANRRMVRAGASRIRIMVLHWKKLARVASGKGLFSLGTTPEAKKIPVRARKIIPTM